MQNLQGLPAVSLYLNREENFIKVQAAEYFLQCKKKSSLFPVSLVNRLTPQSVTNGLQSFPGEI